VKQPVRIALALLPLVGLVALVALFALNMNRDPSLVASVLIDKPAPSFTLPAVQGLPVPGFDTAKLDGHVTVVNVFASWCIPCRDEHPVLEALKQKTGVRLFGINNKDHPDQAAAFLAQLGNPYDAIGADSGFGEEAAVEIERDAFDVAPAIEPQRQLAPGPCEVGGRRARRR